MRSKTKLGLNLFLALALVAAILVSNINLVRAEDQAAAEEFEDQASEIEIDPDNQGTLAEEQPETREEEEPVENVEAGSDESEEALEVSEENQTSASASPQASKNVQDNEFYFEITPEILVKKGSTDDKDALSGSGVKAIGSENTTKIYSGEIKSEAIQKAWENIKFRVFNKDGKEIQLAASDVSIGDHGRLKGAKYIGPFLKGEKYTIEVDTETLPNGYHAWFTAESAYEEKDPNQGDLLTVGEEPKETQDSDKAKNPPKPGLEAAYDNSKFNKSYAETRFHMGVTNVAFARDLAIAKTLFKLDGQGKVTGIDSKYQEGRDYVLATVDKDGKFPEAPKGEVLDKLTPEGYKPEQFIYGGQKESKEARPKWRPYNGIKSSVAFWSLKNIFDEEINTPEKFQSSNTFVSTLYAKIPKVTFNWNYEGAEKPVVKKVSFNKSLKTNMVVSKEDKKPFKTFPKLPKDVNMAFVSWNTKPDGTGQEFTLDTVVTDDITVYAQWSDSVKITFDANGGSGKMDEVTHKVADNPYVLPKCGFKAPKGKVFAGWEIDGKTYKVGDKVKLVKDTVIKALWKEEKTLPKTSTAR